MKVITVHPGDEKILELLTGNDAEMEAGVKLLYRHYYGFLKTYVVSNNGSEQDAEDIFQEVIIAFVNSVRSNKFRGDSSIKTFLFALNRNHWLNELKKNERKSIREENYGKQLEESEGVKLTWIENRQAQEELMRIMSDLGEACKKLLLLFYFENRSMIEIARSLNYENEQVARNKKFKCLKKMEQLVHGNQALYHSLKNYLHE
jgi:RNA polymerase sigma factor (sigma-70 family)